jgi:5'-nucleotidase / UDP-sugar diphosphatase
MIARLLAGTAALALTAGAAAADYTLHILHINDFHSRIEPISGSDSTCSAEDNAAGECFGGVARLYTKVNELRDAIRAEGGNVIVLDAGDQFQGSLMYTTYKGTAEAEFMNAIGFDAMAVGNHEFDDGPEKLAEFVDLVRCPARLGQPRPQPVERAERPDREPSRARGGRRTHRHRLGARHRHRRDLLARAQRHLPGRGRQPRGRCPDPEAEEGVTKIIALTHVGLPKDIDIAGAVPGVDAVVGGHSHTYLSSSESRPGGRLSDLGEPARTARSSPSCRPMPMASTSATSSSPSTTRAT